MDQLMKIVNGLGVTVRRRVRHQLSELTESNVFPAEATGEHRHPNPAALHMLNKACEFIENPNKQD